MKTKLLIKKLLVAFLMVASSFFIGCKSNEVGKYKFINSGDGEGVFLNTETGQYVHVIFSILLDEKNNQFVLSKGCVDSLMTLPDLREYENQESK